MIWNPLLPKRATDFQQGWLRLRSRINTHNQLQAPTTYDYIQLAPGYVREAVDSYDNWDGREHVPSKLKELMMVLRIEVSIRYESAE